MSVNELASNPDSSFHRASTSLVPAGSSSFHRRDETLIPHSSSGSHRRASTSSVPRQPQPRPVREEPIIEKEETSREVRYHFRREPQNPFEDVQMGYRNPPPRYGYPTDIPQTMVEHLDRALRESDEHLQRARKEKEEKEKVEGKLAKKKGAFKKFFKKFMKD